MKRVLFAVVLLGMGMLSAGATASAEGANATVHRFTARLDSSQEIQTPAVVSKATGRATFRITENDTKIRFEISSRGLDRITQAHIHMAPRGQNGGVVPVHQERRER